MKSIYMLLALMFSASVVFGAEELEEANFEQMKGILSDMRDTRASRYMMDDYLYARGATSESALSVRSTGFTNNPFIPSSIDRTSDLADRLFDNIDSHKVEK